MAGTGARFAAAVAVAGLALGGCSLPSASDQDFCTQYARLSAAADALRRAGADQIQARAAQLAARLDQLGAVAEDRLSTAVENLHAALGDLAAAASGGGAAARPLVDQSRDDVRAAFAQLEQAADSECQA